MIGTAYKFMKFDKPKSIGVLVGIVISIFLIGQQLATLRFLMVLMTGLMVNSNTSEEDIWVIDEVSQNINVINSIDARIVQEVRSMEGVATSYSLVMANTSVTFPGGKTTGVNLVGSDGPVFIAGPNAAKIIEGNLNDLYQDHAIAVEHFNAKDLGVTLHRGQAFEINKKTAMVKVLTKNAQGFGGNYMFTSLKNARFYGGLSPDEVSVAVVKLKPGADKQSVINQINQTFYGVKAWDVAQLKNSTVSEILVTSNMGVSFGSLIIFATISGFFIIGLTLYSSALDRLVDYGTLKAIGATNGYVTRLILTQALLFAAAGYTMAVLLLFLFKSGVANAGLIITLDWQLNLLLMAITLFMSVGGSLFAVFKIKRLEPASIF